MLRVFNNILNLFGKVLFFCAVLIVVLQLIPQIYHAILTNGGIALWISIIIEVAILYYTGKFGWIIFHANPWKSNQKENNKQLVKKQTDVIGPLPNVAKVVNDVNEKLNYFLTVSEQYANQIFPERQRVIEYNERILNSIIPDGLNNSKVDAKNKWHNWLESHNDGAEVGNLDRLLDTIYGDRAEKMVKHLIDETLDDSKFAVVGQYSDHAGSGMERDIIIAGSRDIWEFDIKDYQANVGSEYSLRWGEHSVFINKKTPDGRNFHENSLTRSMGKHYHTLSSSLSNSLGERYAYHYVIVFSSDDISVKNTYYNKHNEEISIEAWYQVLNTKNLGSYLKMMNSMDTGFPSLEVQKMLNDKYTKLDKSVIDEMLTVSTDFVGLAKN